MSYVINYCYTVNIGKRRQNNQDNLFCVGEFLDYTNNGVDGIKTGQKKSTDLPVFGVFDGMGGEECGEIAAYIAAKSLSTFRFSKNIKKSYTDLCKSANASICEYAKEHKIISMGTTAAIVKFAKNKIGICNIGDSKIFQLTKNDIQQISYDHIGASAFGIKPPLTQNLGIPENEMIISPYIATGAYLSGDKYLICSDGLTDMVDVESIKRIICDNTDVTAAKMLLEEALKNGGKDNITLILISIEKNKSFFKIKRGKKSCL